MTVAAYDAHADWYEEFVTSNPAEFTDRLHRMLSTLLQPGQGICLDLCCGTGFHAEHLRGLGYTPVGVDMSSGQLRYARSRLPVVHGDAARLPLADSSVPAVVCLCAHTDLPDYLTVLAEVHRVLRPGGRFVHIGVHPCFVGAFADWSARPTVRVDERYADRSTVSTPGPRTGSGPESAPGTCRWPTCSMPPSGPDWTCGR